MFSFFKKRTVVGLDIHPDEVRLLQLSYKKNHFYVEQLMCVDLPQAVVMDGKIKNPTVLSQVIQQAVQEARVKGCSAAIALPAASVITQRLQLSRDLTDEEREAEIISHWGNYFPGSIEDIYFDFSVLSANDDMSHEVLLVAARREHVQEYLEVVNQAGLDVACVDVDLFALGRGIYLTHPCPTTFAVLDFGLLRTQFTIYSQQQLIFSETLRAAEWVSQFKSALQLFSSLHRGVKWNTLFVCGEKTFLSFASENLEKEWGLKIIKANPLASTQLSPTIKNTNYMSFSTRMSSCYGLARRGFEWLT